jgi:hypothetical protein
MHKIWVAIRIKILTPVPLIEGLLHSYDTEYEIIDVCCFLMPLLAFPNRY